MKENMTEAMFSYHRQTPKPVGELFVLIVKSIHEKIVYCLLFGLLFILFRGDWKYCKNILWFDHIIMQSNFVKSILILVFIYFRNLIGANQIPPSYRTHCTYTFTSRKGGKLSKDIFLFTAPFN